MNTSKGLSGEYFKNPNDLFYAADTAHEYVILGALLFYSNGKSNGVITASFRTLGFGIVQRRQCIRIMQKFQELKFLKMRKVAPYQPNEIILDIQQILWYARKRMDIETLGRKAIREYTEKAQDAMTVRRSVKKPELAHKALEIVKKNKRGTK